MLHPCENGYQCSTKFEYGLRLHSHTGETYKNICTSYITCIIYISSPNKKRKTEAVKKIHKFQQQIYNAICFQFITFLLLIAYDSITNFQYFIRKLVILKYLYSYIHMTCGSFSFSPCRYGCFFQHNFPFFNKSFTCIFHF